jgi:hypothetical protein
LYGKGRKWKGDVGVMPEKYRLEWIFPTEPFSLKDVHTMLG